MKYAQIMEVKLGLQQLGKERLPVAFEIAKNIRICDKVINEALDIAKELHSQFADKEEDGKTVKSYKDDEGREVSKISDTSKLAEYQDELKKLDAEEHDVHFVVINKNKLEAFNLSADLLLPLVDTVIVE